MCISDVSNYSSIKFYVRIRSTDGKYLTVYCRFCAFIISDVNTIYCFSVCAKSLKTTFSVFVSFFLVKLSKSPSLKLSISRTAWPILMIFVLFWRTLNRRSDEINLFGRCSSPLSTVYKLCIQRQMVLTHIFLFHALPVFSIKYSHKLCIQSQMVV